MFINAKKGLEQRFRLEECSRTDEKECQKIHVFPLSVLLNYLKWPPTASMTLKSLKTIYENQEL